MANSHSHRRLRPRWPQVAELVTVLPGDQWTLIGGLMVQLHPIRAGLPAIRATVDVDMVLHIEAGATTFDRARRALETLRYELQIPSRRRAPIHRFVRKSDQLDVMVADHLAPSHCPAVAGRPVFQVPAGTSALRKTASCELEIRPGVIITLSIPDVLGALVLKGAAYLEDPRDRDRHLDDAAVLVCALTTPRVEATRMAGSDRSRIRTLAQKLSDPTHRSWLLVPREIRQHGFDSLRVLARQPGQDVEIPRLGGSR